MSLLTHSKIYLGFVIDEDNYQLDFDEGGGELTAELSLGSYTFEQLADEIASALNTAGALTYVVTVDRANRTFEISAGSNFTLYVSSGSHVGTSIFTTIGFVGADLAGDNDYVGAECGTSYATQFIVQSHCSSDNEQAAAYGTINKSASGKIEVVSFGTEEFVEFELKFITDRDVGSNAPIRSNATGVAEAQALMQYLITKGPIEWMEDEDDTASFQNLILESTPEDSSKGLKYKLKEMYSIGLPGFFQTGVLKFRVTE